MSLGSIIHDAWMPLWVSGKVYSGQLRFSRRTLPILNPRSAREPMYGACFLSGGLRCAYPPACSPAGLASRSGRLLLALDVGGLDDFGVLGYFRFYQRGELFRGGD